MKKLLTKLTLNIVLLGCALLPQATFAQVLLSGGTYSQNFDSLANSGSPTWADNTTLPGWFAARASGGANGIVTSYVVGAGAGTTGGIYSFGPASASNRALGSLSSSTPKILYYGVALTNDTASAQTTFAISYTGEEWRSPSVASNEFLAFSYRVAGSAAISDMDVTNDPLWTAFNGLTFTIPETVNILNSALDGTNPTNQVVFTNVVLAGVSLQPGQALFLRWRDIDDAGSDAALAIDNLTVSFTTTIAGPAPAYLAIQPTNTSVFLGDLAAFSALGGGTAPFTYQWYYTNSSGVTLLSGQTNTSLSFSYVTTNVAGGYFVAVTNSAGGTNSAVANLTVNTRTPIVTSLAYLRTLLNPTSWAPTDTTNIYTAQGVCISHANTTGTTNAQFYIQSGAAGMLVFISGGVSQLPAAGDLVQVTGPLGQFFGQLEFNLSDNNPAHSFTNISSGNPLPTPALFNFAQQSNLAYMKSVESSLMVISNVYLTNGYFLSGSAIAMTNAGNVTFPLYVNPYVADIVAQSIPAYAASITGVMAQHAAGTIFTNGFQFIATQFADIVSGTPSIIPIPLSFSYTGGSLSLTWTDATFTLQTATNVTGPYTDVTGATSPFSTNAAASSLPAQFFRLTHP